MTDGESREPTPEEDRARDAIRSLPQVEADGAFRDRLKADFVAGRLGGEAAPGRAA